MIRSSTANWYGSGLKGKGFLTTESLIIKKAPFDFKGRFAIVSEAISPEELLAAAHAGCFTMKLSFILCEEGYIPESLETVARVKIENGGIISSHLTLSAKISGITTALLKKCVEEAERTCPISRALNIKITNEVHLEYTV